MKSLFMFIVLLAALVISTNTLISAPYNTGFITWTQPNATTFTAKLWGDEFIWWMETQSGYRIIRGSDGWYYYAAIGTDGDYVPSSYKVGIDYPPTQTTQPLERWASFMNTVNQQRASFDSVIAQNAQWFAQEQAANGSAPDTINIGVIFVEFADADVKHYKDITNPDLQFGYKKSTFDNMLFSQDYWIGVQGNAKHPEGDPLFGSMRDYYYQISRGNLILTGTFINPTDANGVPIWLTIGNRLDYDYYHPAVTNNMYPDAIAAVRTMYGSDPAAAIASGYMLLV